MQNCNALSDDSLTNFLDAVQIKCELERISKKRREELQHITEYLTKLFEIYDVNTPEFQQQKLTLKEEYLVGDLNHL